MPHVHSLLCLLAALPLASAHAADWSDTSLGYRYGTRFAEPFGANNVRKSIFSLTHVSGFKYGTNFFNVDIVLSDGKDPGYDTTAGAQEVYVFYRNTVDAGKVLGRDLKSGPVRGWGVTSGFDINTKNNNYGSKKRMFVLGPTLMLDVPGYLNLTVLAVHESNAPRGVERYTYRTHPAFEIDWSTPFQVATVPLSFEGYALYLAAKGTDEFGAATAPEMHIDMKLMGDVGAVAGMGKNVLKFGIGFEYWRNKFGNPTSARSGCGPGRDRQDSDAAPRVPLLSRDAPRRFKRLTAESSSNARLQPVRHGRKHRRRTSASQE
jgi:nucleoside-specific outer membrane channel protein Tsx